MPPEQDPQQTGERVEQLLAEIESIAEPEVRERAEELVRELMQLYGAGLAKVVELAASTGSADSANPAAANPASAHPVPPGDTGMLGRMLSDELLTGLLVMHDLHPVGVAERVEQALETVRPYLGSHSGGVEFRGIDDDAIVHLRLQGNCEGCPSSTETVKLAIERAIAEAAPEIAGLDVEGMNEPDRPDTPTAPAEPNLIPVESLLHGPTGPRAGHGTAEVGPAEWSTVQGLAGLDTGQVRCVEHDGLRIVACRAEGELYAYRDACAACDSSLDGAGLAGTELGCPACGAAFDVRLAGRQAGSGQRRLEPLPLLAGDGEVRIAVPAGAAR